MQKYLKGIGSKLERQECEPITLYQKLHLVQRISDKVVDGQFVPVFTPKNVALLFFNHDPPQFFKGAWAEIAIFSHDNYSKAVKIVDGPIDQQIEKCLSFILEKPKEVECHAFVAYPRRALREAVVNAFHHRSYENSDPDPVKIHIKPGYIDIISYPGPDPSLKPEQFSENKVPPVPSRNRRIADFLKKMKLAEALYTGVGTIFSSMKENNSPTPQFTFSPKFFCVRLPGHPKYFVQSIKSKVDNLCAEGNESEAVELLTGFLEENPSMWSEILIVKLLELLKIEDDGGDPKVVQYQEFISERKQRRAPLKEELSKWCASEKWEIAKGVKLIKTLVDEGATLDDVSCVKSMVNDLCHLKDDRGRQQLEALQMANKLFEAMGEVTFTDATLSFQYAECKFNLYMLNLLNLTQENRESKDRKPSREGKAGYRERSRNLFPLLQKAEDYVHAAIQLTKEDDKQQLAIEYRLLGYIHSKKCAPEIHRSTEKQVTDCYDKARRYDPKIKINRLFIPSSCGSRYFLVKELKAESVSTEKN